MSPERIAELHRTTLNMDVLDAVPVQPVCSADLDSQVHALRALATLFGLYDGADFLRYRRNPGAVSTPTSEIVRVDVWKAIPQQQQVQSVTEDQIDALELIARRFGLLVAADAVARRFVGK